MKFIKNYQKLLKIIINTISIAVIPNDHISVFLL